MDSKRDLSLIIEETKNENKAELLSLISNDYITSILVLRWIEFLLERVSRDKIATLLNYYREIGWLSDQAKSQIMTFARGEVADVHAFDMEESEVPVMAVDDSDYQVAPVYKNASDWRLTAEEHLKSLLFILKIKGIKIDRERLNSLEIDIKSFKSKLESHHGI